MLNGFGDAGADRDAARGARQRVRRQGRLQRRRHVEAGADPRDGEGHAQQELGGVDILVNNAGIQHTAPVESFPLERWDAIIAINLSSAFHAIQAALPADAGAQLGPHHQHRLDARPGRLGRQVGLRRGQARRGRADQGGGAGDGQTGITCNAICPGWVLTPLVQKQIDERAKREGIAVEQAKADLLAEKQPSGNSSRPSRSARSCVFLCSDAAAQIRGAALPVDGGWLAQ